MRLCEAANGTFIAPQWEQSLSAAAPSRSGASRGRPLPCQRSVDTYCARGRATGSLARSHVASPGSVGMVEAL